MELWLEFGKGFLRLETGANMPHEFLNKSMQSYIRPIYEWSCGQIHMSTYEEYIGRI